ncbi:MAG: outer membrane beta-barrel protein [Planctomycetota bacterium]|nr:outer membrane beta-barrel protein [Planctomycetota bacterium]
MILRIRFLLLMSCCLLTATNLLRAQSPSDIPCDADCLPKLSEELKADPMDCCGTGYEQETWWAGLMEGKKTLFSGLNEQLKPLGISVGGYMLHGVNTTSDDPTNPPSGFGNLPAAGLVYRSDDYQLNRILLSASRKPQPFIGGWNLGGVVTMMYGSDYFALQSRGLEAEGDFSNNWNSDSGSGLLGRALMGVAMPNLYALAVKDDVSVKLGHFFHPGGLEQFESLGTGIAYSATYSSSFVAFRFVTGMETEWKANEQTTVLGGFHRGRRNWGDNNNHLNGFGGFRWKSCDKKTEFAYIMDIGAEDNAGNNQQYVQSIVASQKLADKLTYMIHSDYGYVENEGINRSSAQFLSFVNYIFYDLNKKWVVGCRYEVFDDMGGTRVIPRPGFPAQAPGIWQQFAIGAVYKMTPDVWLRWGLRWDWFNPDGPAPAGPFNEGKKRDQTMLFMAMQITL